MTNAKNLFAGAVGVVLLGAAAPGFADQYGTDDDDLPPSGIGISMSVGAGVAGFQDRDLRSTTDIGGLWDVRAVIGTRSLLALELAYVGTAQAIDSQFGEQQSATLIGTGVEGAARLNFMPLEAATPYVFAGLGYKRYDVRGADFMTAGTGIADEDTLLEVPLGGGLAFRVDRFIADARFTYRIATGEDLAVAVTDNGDVDIDAAALPMDTWSAAARVGFEY